MYYKNTRQAVKNFEVDNTFDIDEPFFKTNSNTLSYAERVKQSIKVILSTKVGTRFFQPDFGCKLYNYLYEQNTLVMKDIVKRDIETSLTRWEPRITLNLVSVVYDNIKSSLKITINYTINTLSFDDEYIFNVMNGEID